MRYGLKKRLAFILSVSFIFSLTSCSGLFFKKTAYPPPKKGFYYTVKKGDTLWRISNLYHVDIEDIIKENRVSDPKKLSIGQKLFLPQTKAVSKMSTAPPEIMEDFIWPVKGPVISRFGSHNKKKNNGIDIKSDEESSILAVASGKVIFSDNGPEGYGKMVIIKHSNNYVTIYSNNRENLVRVNHVVKQGEKIAKVGKSKDSKESFLHFEIRKNRIPRDPLLYLP
jgi:murein DD-endopeptidase MepM/ murein hydrolase activator NlpD